VSALRKAALAAIALLVAAASVASFAESFRALLDWALHHGPHGVWALAWPVQIDTFIAVGELALIVALAITGVLAAALARGWSRSPDWPYRWPGTSATSLPPTGLAELLLRFRRWLPLPLLRSGWACSSAWCSTHREMCL
jgi:hypothetical protein